MTGVPCVSCGMQFDGTFCSRSAQPCSSHPGCTSPSPSVAPMVMVASPAWRAARCALLSVGVAVSLMAYRALLFFVTFYTT